MLIKNLARQTWNNKFEREHKIYAIAVCIIGWVAIVYVASISSRYRNFAEKNQRISLDLTTVEQVQLTDDAELTQGHNVNCSYWDCFDVYRCGEQLSIYVYPFYDYMDSTAGFSSLSILSREFFEILKIIVESPYYTADPKSACVFVPSIDTLNLNLMKPATVSKALATLPYWENGENHLLFNMVPYNNDVALLNTDRAMMVGADFDVWNFRTGFDFPIPFLGYSRDESIKADRSLNRSIWLVASIINIPDIHRTTIVDIATRTDKPILLLDKCPRTIINRSKLGVRCVMFC